MKRLILNHWYYIALIGLAVVTFGLAVKQTRDRSEADRQNCIQQGGEMFDYGRYTLCRVKGDAR